MRWALLGLALVLACDADAWKLPTAPDARPTVGAGEACITLWDCHPGLLCTRGVCAAAPSDPCSSYYEDCPADAYVWRDDDAAIDASISDAFADDAGIDDANADDANAGDAVAD